MVERICWLLIAAIHLTPALALFRPALITRLYSVEPGVASFPLLQHRAALFLVIVVVCVWAAFDPTSRRIAAIAAGISMATFLIVYAGAGFPPALRTIAIADVIGLTLLAYVAWAAFA